MPWPRARCCQKNVVCWRDAVMMSERKRPGDDLLCAVSGREDEAKVRIQDQFVQGGLD
jgi:hypothetical protein